jgi:hypothetical protein
MYKAVAAVYPLLLLYSFFIVHCDGLVVDDGCTYVASDKISFYDLSKMTLLPTYVVALVVDDACVVGEQLQEMLVYVIFPYSFFFLYCICYCRCCFSCGCLLVVCGNFLLIQLN